MPEIHTGWKPKKDDDEETREHGRRYWTRRDIRSAGQLTCLRSSVRRRLGRIRVPVTAVISSDDPTVPMEVAGLLSRRLSGGLEDLLIVGGCGHNVPQGAAREETADAVLKWLERRG
jgi:pimeloyl-ACP methyl ester carboxylesterase